MLVAGYCRVSTDKEDQVNSFRSQQRYFREYIGCHPEWELYQIYADEGITGTSTQKRAAFLRMIDDAHQGKFQLIVTKEVSRFARNILDTIGFTRELKGIGVGVIFTSDGIHTLDSDAELRLSIMGSIAQEESRKTSERVKWGQARQMERGVVFGRSMLGYDVEGGKLTVNEEGAKIVRLIFTKYGIEKKGTSTIARELQDAGYYTYSGNHRWSNSHINKILQNEKYVGDLVQRKTFTPDYLTHQKKTNHGEVEKITISDHHAPIIDRQLWDLVQAERIRRNRHSSVSGHGTRYALSGKIKCGACGASFVSRHRRQNGITRQYWSCYTAASEGKRRIDPLRNSIGCDIGIHLRNDIAVDMLKQAMASLGLKRDALIPNLTNLAMGVIGQREQRKEEDVKHLLQEIDLVKSKKLNLMDAFLSGDIYRQEMLEIKAHYDEQLAALQTRLQGEQDNRDVLQNQQHIREDIQKELSALLCGDVTSDALCRTVLERITVYPNREAEVKLVNLSNCWRFQIP